VVVVIGEQFDQFVTGALVDQFVVPPDGGFAVHCRSSAMLVKSRPVAVTVVFG
jgi:hypothetical protein